MISKSTALDPGARAGVGVGALLGVAALAALGYLLFRRRRRNRGTLTEPDWRYDAPMAPVEMAFEPKNPYEKFELAARSARVEIEATNDGIAANRQPAHSSDQT